MSEQTPVPTLEQTPPAKVTFTPEQQVRIDSLIRESMGRAGNEARATAARLEAEAEVLRAEVARLRGDRAGLETNLTAKDKEAKAAREETIAVKKQNAIQELGAKYNFYNPAQLAKLVGEDLKWDGDKQKFVVLGED